ncbi:cysteine--tRNA ligase [Candidatus Peribacteria bacterium]|nr:MAG: cysteine--tRNA ligase [Candidatus Peribacteria bacterium]
MPSSNPLRLYNSLTKHEEDFVPQNGKDVTMYTCGPTVYGRPHIGNYSSFLMADLLRRWLEVRGHTVHHVKNITDVGHLVADAESGEDKIEKQAREEKADPLAIARHYTEQYLADEKALNMLEPEARPRATETISEMIEMIESLLKNGHAYETEDGVYFDVTSFPKYGELSGNTLDNIDAGARVKVDEKKKHPADFALWKKTVGENAHHMLKWPSPWGEGFPGWHIECSAMSRKFLGNTIDIHTGGEDNIFPHHECEIAQSECVTHLPFVHTWLHKRRIDMGDEKMSKSLGNVLTIPDIIAQGYDPMDLRYYLLSVHYRTRLKFTEKGMDDSRKAREKIVAWMEEVMQEVEKRSAMNDDENDHCDHHENDQEMLAKLYGDFRDAMNSDLNTPAALAAIFEMISWYRNSAHLCADTLADLHMVITFIRHTFGCFDASENAVEISADVQELLDARETARAEKNFAESDRLRDAILERGFVVKDTADGQTVTPA